ncbi:MAG: RIP metalloprotease RseP [Burkholderiales bacterium]|nr:RIP metalloprotease RseP [Burkholderiales bacterium]
MTYLIGLIVTLGLLIVVHEYGHYRVAVACGVKVQRFSVGFGRVLWRRQRSPDATEFVVCALPLGGYVRMLDEREGSVPAEQLGQAFNRKSLRQRSAIVAAGPLANLALAVLLFAGAYWVGMEEPKAVLGPSVPGSLAERAGLKSGDWVRAMADAGSGGDSVQWRDVQSMNDLMWRLTQAALQREPVRLQVSDRDGRGSRTLLLDLATFEPRDVDGALARKIGLGAAFGEPVLGRLKEAGPAVRAGLAEGDRVLSIDGRSVPDAQSLRERIRASAAAAAPGAKDAPVQRWLVERAGRSLEIQVAPRIDTSVTPPIGRIEAYVGTPPAMVTVRHGPWDGIVGGFERMWDTSLFTLKMLGRMLIGEASIKNLSGPISIADYAGQSVQQGPARFLEFLAIVSVSLGVLNLLPLPMLDGGHLMVYIFEGVTGRAVSEEWLARLQRGGIAVLLMMMSVALYNDVARLLGLH